MYRDDLILQGIAAGATSTATLAEHTGISTASVWRGLRRLMGSSHVFSPARGVYRLTDSGAALLGLPDGVPAAPEQSAEATHDQPLAGLQSIITPGNGQIGPDRHHDAMDPHEGDAALPFAAIASRFDWGALAVGVVIALGALGLAVLAARRAAPRPSMSPEEGPKPRASQPVWPDIGPVW
jgi:hypothetical protein